MTRIKFVSAKVEAKSARCRFIGSSNLRMKIALVLKATWVVIWIKSKMQLQEEE